ncbi:hypothetical protein PN36_14805 [Candidatus Thiomargarita nelsonii]|uniref:Uncharacterized protein n=1 Tax=Candidatus Thiomargarita nelsonii TaxID=1003181 RepID=A0A0A6RT52_9GAMM|nr:hypothetical protein PN36_14805 [Candidatus Thiomargarita nelsonii]
MNTQTSKTVKAAVMWYEKGMVSQEKAAEIAGLCREDFIMALTQFDISPSFVHQPFSGKLDYS